MGDSARQRRPAKGGKGSPLDASMRRNFPPAPNDLKKGSFKVKTTFNTGEKIIVEEEIKVLGADTSVKAFINATDIPVEKQSFMVFFLNPYAEFIPGEIAVVVFSLEKGIKLADSLIVRPVLRINDPYLHYALTELKLPPLNFDVVKKEYPALADVTPVEDHASILQIIEGAMDDERVSIPGHGEFEYVLFTPAVMVDKVKGAFAWMRDQSQIDFEPRIFKLEELICALAERRKNVCDSALWCSPMYANFMVQRNNLYENVAQLACVWHQEDHIRAYAHQCALHKAKSLVFMILRNLCPMFGITIDYRSHYIEEERPKMPPIKIIEPPKYGMSKERWESTLEERSQMKLLHREIQLRRQERMKKFREERRVTTGLDESEVTNLWEQKELENSDKEFQTVWKLMEKAWKVTPSGAEENDKGDAAN